MIVKARTTFVAVPLAAALAAATTVGIFETPWNALPGVFDGVVTTVSGPLVALGRVATQPDATETPIADTPVTVLDTATVIDPVVEPAPEPEPVAVVQAPDRIILQREPNDPIDYSRLNADVRVVTDTLERFNQKLLRMIAQAKAANTLQNTLEAGTTVALDSPVQPDGELKQ